MELHNSVNHITLPKSFTHGHNCNTMTDPRLDGRSQLDQIGNKNDISFASSQANNSTLNYDDTPNNNSLLNRGVLSDGEQNIGNQNESSRQMAFELLNQIMTAISRIMKQYGSSNHTDAASDENDTAYDSPSPQQPAAGETTQQDTPPSDSVKQNDKPSDIPISTVTGGSTAGDGPRNFNITNTQDHDIQIGQFDKNNQLVAEMTLKPGQSGQMKYQNDFTGLLKQADADGKYQDSASRLEFYNGYVNTSDIDGRNAAIYATDHKGFEIGDKQSIADSAPDDVVSKDSAGNKTIAGWYDGSTDTMRKGGQFMTDKLGTGMTYMHPDDDKLSPGNNPMRHTDAMTLDVIFGKA